MVSLASTARFVGSDAESRARVYCRSLLEERGFEVTDQTFGFSEAPGRWGPPLGALLAATVVWLAAYLGTSLDAPVLGLLEDVIGLGLLSLASFWMTRYGILSLSLSRSNATNLVAVRAGARAEPPVWVVAHLDSKSQTIPMAVRVGSAVSFAVMSAGVMVSLIVLAALKFPVHATGIDAAFFASTAAVLSYLAVAAAIPIIFCFVGNKSRGALDNATGVASIILAIDNLSSDAEVGVLITSGEELGLAGARHFAATRGKAGIAINCDTVDDAGRFICMASSAKSRRLEEAIDRAASRLHAGTVAVESQMRSDTGRRRTLGLRGMLPGILADNMAFTDAGWESFTLSRGNIATLRCVHTSRDTPDRVKGTGIAKAASLIAAIVEELA